MIEAPSPSFSIPEEAKAVFARFIATEYAYFTPRGEPLCWPVSPYWYPDRGVLAIATGIAYPKKADYAKVHPRVSLFFSDATGSGLPAFPRVLVQGNATVLDEDIQANTDRYVREIREKFPAARLGLNPLSVKFLDFYLPRLWVEITPVRLLIYRDEISAPEVHGAPLESEASSAYENPPIERKVNQETLAKLWGIALRMPDPVVTVRGSGGFPEMLRAKVRHREAEAGRRIVSDRASFLELSGSPGLGNAALTFHKHTLRGTRFQAFMARGSLTAPQGTPVFVPQRLAGFFGNGVVFPLSAVPGIAKLKRSLGRELLKRGAAMPKLRIPKD